MSQVSAASRAAASLLATALVATAITLVGAPAYAADVDVDGITYSEVVDGDPSEGVTVTGYTPADNPDHPSVTIDSSVEIGGESYDVLSVGAGVFDDAGLTEVDLPDGLQTIGAEAFIDNELTGLELPSSVTSVARAAFYNNELTTVSLGSVTALGTVAFASNDLTRVWIPATVTQMGGSVFANTYSLTQVTFQGAAPTYSGAADQNPITTTSVNPDLEVRFPLEHADTFSYPTWYGLDTVPVAAVTYSDPFLNVPFPYVTMYIPLDQGDAEPYGYIPLGEHPLFELEAPEGYALAGWNANGELWEVEDPITEDTVLTPLWLDTTRVLSVVITPSAVEVEEGESVTMSAEGFNGLGESLGDVTADMEFGSDVATDVVDGATITFPTASPHTISGMYLPLEIRAEPVVIEVLPAQVEEEDEEPAPEPTPEPEPTPVADGGSDVITALPAAELAETGLEEQRSTIAAAAILIALGLSLVIGRRRVS